MTQVLTWLAFRQQGYEDKFLSFLEFGRISGMIAAIGALLVLVSFGVGKRKKRPEDEGTA